MGKRSESKRSEDDIRCSMEGYVETVSLAEARPEPCRFRSTLEFWRSKETHMDHRKPRPFVLRRNNTVPHMRKAQELRTSVKAAHDGAHPYAPRQTIIKRDPKHRRVESVSTCSRLDSSVSPSIDDFLSDDDGSSSCDKHGTRRVRPASRGGSPVGVGSSLKAEVVELVERRLGTPMGTPRVVTRGCLGGSVSSALMGTRHSGCSQSSQSPIVAMQPAASATGPKHTVAAQPPASTTATQPSSETSGLDSGDSPKDLRSSQWLEVEPRWQAALRNESAPLVMRRLSAGSTRSSDMKEQKSLSRRNSASSFQTPKQESRHIEQPASEVSEQPVPITWGVPSRCSSMSEEELDNMSLDNVSLGSMEEPAAPVTWHPPSRSSSMPSLDRTSLLSDASGERPGPVTWEAPSRSASMSRDSSPRSLASMCEVASEEPQPDRFEPESMPLPRWPAIEDEPEVVHSSCGSTDSTCSSSNLSLGWSRSYAKLPGVAGSE